MSRGERRERREGGETEYYRDVVRDGFDSLSLLLYGRPLGDGAARLRLSLVDPATAPAKASRLLRRLAGSVVDLQAENDADRPRRRPGAAAAADVAVFVAEAKVRLTTMGRHVAEAARRPAAAGGAAAAAEWAFLGDAAFAAVRRDTAAVGELVPAAAPYLAGLRGVLAAAAADGAAAERSLAELAALLDGAAAAAALVDSDAAAYLRELHSVAAETVTIAASPPAPAPAAAPAPAPAAAAVPAAAAAAVAAAAAAAVPAAAAVAAAAVAAAPAVAATPDGPTAAGPMSPLLTLSQASSRDLEPLRLAADADEAQVVALVCGFYQRHNPDKASESADIVAAFSGYWPYLVGSLNSKYLGVPMPSCTVPPDEGDGKGEGNGGAGDGVRCGRGDDHGEKSNGGVEDGDKGHGGDDGQKDEGKRNGEGSDINEGVKGNDGGGGHEGDRTSPPALAPIAYRPDMTAAELADALRGLYAVCAPEKVPRVDEVVARYDGQLGRLVELINDKYAGGEAAAPVTEARPESAAGPQAPTDTADGAWCAVQ